MKRLFPLALFCAMILGAIPMSVSAAPATANYVCLIVLDAGRPDYITNHISQMPTMKAFLQTARWYNRAWVGDLMSITPPGHAVIGTGSLPKDDGGIVNWDWGIHATGKISPTMQALQSYQNGWAFKLIKDSGTPTLAGVIHTKYPKGLVIAGSGAHFHAAGPLGGPDANWIFSYDRLTGNWAPYSLSPGHPVPSSLLQDPSLRTPLVSSNGSSVPLVYDPVKLGAQDSLVMNFAIKSLQQYRPRGILINLPEVDTVGHWSLNWYPEETRLYRSFDADLGRLVAAYKQAGIYHQTMFVITADHGMIQSQNRVMNKDAVVSFIRGMLGQKSIILTNGGGKGGPTMTPIWLKDPAQNGRTATAIFKQHFANVSAVYYMTHVGGRYAYKMAGCESCSADLKATYDYLLSTEAGPTGEDIAILQRENSRNSGLDRMRGRHGGADWGSQHITLVISGPGVSAGVSHHPARLTDIAPTIERAMGITPHARDGVVLADAFQNPIAGDVAAQNHSDAAGTMYVNALMQRAQQDVALERRGELANGVVAAPAKRGLPLALEGALSLSMVLALAWVVVGVRR
jgi:predicted AlkP superfamily pyrophosphatase or phosphodiesterase